MAGAGLPIDLVLVRHGESEGNLAQRFSKKGDDRMWTPEFQSRHTSRYRLTDDGRRQAVEAGKWIRKHLPGHFDRYYCSEYARAMETAGLLGMDNADWFVEFYLREQDRGVLAGRSTLQRKKYHQEEMRYAKTDSFYWTPPGGESMANACLRIDRFLDSLKKNCSGFKVLVVCHGNMMKGFRVRLERMSQTAYREFEERSSVDPKLKMHNCQIMHYSRRDPITGRVYPELRWKRSVCPWDASKSTNEWEEITRPHFSNAALLDAVSHIPQILNTDLAKALPPLDPSMVGRTATLDTITKQEHVGKMEKCEDEHEQEQDVERMCVDPVVPLTSSSSSLSTAK
eukprot:CAMPEP_0177655688 /NCGR_PEP_ID=MMETSP0447-20121125/15118_1 /TAXON_ID=0 /ORGANISM="Stygamoeba regulata, Strain BSH-02190019" /LENGTH=340 /DNA_ID=CAMNT_0019159659 /DNA_START=94 /DNA_END=1116 /DNA_ORIENTATION=+